MLRVARLCPDAASLQLIPDTLTLDTERVTEPAVRRALEAWVSEHGEKDAQYVAVDVITAPVTLHEEVQVTRVVKLADGTEVGRFVRQQGNYLVAEHEGKQTKHNGRYASVEPKEQAAK